MKPWLINILIILGVLIIIFTFPAQILKPLLLIVVVGSAIWVYTDSKKLEIAKYKKTALSLSSSPFGAAFVVWLLWIIAFPMYISWRQRVKDGKIPLKEATA